LPTSIIVADNAVALGSAIGGSAGIARSIPIDGSERVGGGSMAIPVRPGKGLCASAAENGRNPAAKVEILIAKRRIAEDLAVLARI
jgi:hypothetical protein